MLYNTERPEVLDDVVGQDAVVSSVRSQSILNSFFQVHIMAGHWGTGKTTIARIIRLLANCEHKDEQGNACMKCESCKSILSGRSADITEIDGASNNGVDKVRELIDKAQYMPVSLKYKVYIIDEVHMLSESAFNALLKLLEEPPAHCIFILCTTELHKIPYTVVSRAALYRFRRIKPAVIQAKLKNSAQKYGVTVTDEALKLMAKLSQGAMRDAFKVLEQCMNASKTIDEDLVKSIFGVEDSAAIFGLMNSLVGDDKARIIRSVNDFYDAGRDFIMLVDDILAYMSDTIVYLSTGDKHTIDGTESYVQGIVSLGNIVTLEKLFYLNSEIFELRNALRNDNSRTTVLVHLLRMSSGAGSSNELLLSRISELEKEVKDLHVRFQFGVSSEAAGNSAKVVPEQLQEKEAVISVTETAAPSENAVAEADKPLPEVKETKKGKKEHPVTSETTAEADVELNFLNDMFGTVQTAPEQQEVPEKIDEEVGRCQSPNDTGEEENDGLYTASEECDLTEEEYYRTLSEGVCTENNNEEPEIDGSSFPETSDKSPSTGEGGDASAIREEKEEEISEPSPDAVKEFEKLSSYAIAKAAVSSCKRQTKDGDIILISSLKPHYDILSTHIKVIGSSHLQVVMA